MGEHLSRLWVALQCASVLVDLIHFGWSCIQKASPSASLGSKPLMMLILWLDCNLLSLPESLINFIAVLRNPSSALIWLLFLICTLKRIILTWQCLQWLRKILCSSFLLVCSKPSCLYDFSLLSYYCFYTNSTAHLHGEYPLGHQWRWKFCGII